MVSWGPIVQTMEGEEQEVYSTQPTDDLDKAIYLEIKRKLVHKDKKSYELSLRDIYQNNFKDIKYVRESLYDYG